MDGTWQHLTQGGGGRGGVVGFAWGHMPMLMVIYFCMQKVIRDINQTLLRSLSLSCRASLTLWNVRMRNVWLFAKMPKAPICQSRPTTLIVESVALLVWKSDLIKGPLLQQIKNWEKTGKTRINVGVGQKWHKCCFFWSGKKTGKTLLLARNWVFTSYCMCQLSWLSSAIPPFSTLTIAHTLPRGTSLPHPDKISPSPLGAKLVISNLQISYNTVVISRLKVKCLKSCHFRYWQFSGKIIDSFMIANNLDDDDGSDGIVH